MSSNSVVVDKYAKVAFGISKKFNLGEVFINDLEIFCKNISKFLPELTNPAISRIALENIIHDLTKKLKTNSHLVDFLIILAKSRRLNLIEKVYQKLEELVKKDQNILQVEIISAKKLKADQLAHTKKLLKEQYPNSEIEIQQTIKEDIIGGIVIKIGSFVIDTSIKSQLSSIYSDVKSII